MSEYQRNGVRDIAPFANIRRVQNRGTAIDTHELLKLELDRQNYNSGNSSYSSLNVSSFADKQLSSLSDEVDTSQLVDKYGFNDNEINFDSVHREGTSDIANGELFWYVTPLNNNVELTGIVAASLIPFYFPKINVPTSAPDFMYYNRVYLEMSSISSTQAILGYAGQKFHFECEVTNLAGPGVLLTPLKPQFYFNSPVIDLSELRMKFYVPQTNPLNSNFKPVPIPQDTTQITVIPGTNPIQFQITGLADTTILGNVGVPSGAGVAIFITGFFSNDAGVNGQVNSGNGVFVTNIINNTTFSIGSINGTTVAVAATATMFVAKNRIAFPIRFTCLRNYVTNRIAITHS